MQARSTRAVQDQADRLGIVPDLGRDLVEDAHACTTRGSDSEYGARCTPSSVTIAPISSAGVTSNAGLRAAKREVISAPARSSIGIPAPVAVSGSIVEVGATT